MKTKLLIGLTAASAASLFWACGSGDIYELNDDDSNVQMLYTDPTEVRALKGMVDSAVAHYCATQADPDCMEKTAAGFNGSVEQPIASSSSIRTIDPNNPIPTNPDPQNPGTVSPERLSISGNTSLSSSSIGFNPGFPGNFSSSQPIVTSSGNPTTNPNAFVTCIPSVTQVSKGGSIVWNAQPQQSAMTVQELMSLKYSWVFDGTTTPTATTQKTTVTYTTPGKFTPTLVVTKGAESQTITCPTIDVMGAPVTGCKCTAQASKVDFGSASVAAGTSTAYWSVTDCQSTNTEYSYVWSDNLGTGPSAGAAIAQKTTYAPTVKVVNGENGIMNVTCDAVQFMNSDDPDYIITSVNDKITVPSGDFVLIMDMPANWRIAGQPCNLRCEGNNTQISFSINGGTPSETNYSTTLPLNVSQTTGKQPLMVNLKVLNATGTGTATCKIE